jgi:hypothetical protein
MSKRLRIQSDMAFDNAGSNTAIPLTVGTERFLDSLTLELTNREELVLVQGVFSVSLPIVVSVVGGNVSATIKVYRDAALTNLAYTFNDSLLVTELVSISIPATNYQVPIQFEEVPPLKVTDDTVHYYVTITLNQIGLALAAEAASLAKYSIVAQEIAQ